MVFIALIGLAVFLNRSETITRGLRLNPFIHDEVQYKAWSYGTWTEDFRSGVHVSTFEGPYKVIVAIEPHDQSLEEVEMISAEIVLENGEVIGVLDKLVDQIEPIARRDETGRAKGYASFVFDAVVHTNADIILRLHFQMRGEGRQIEKDEDLNIQGFERREKGLLIIDQVMGI